MSNVPRGASAARILVNGDVVTKLDTVRTGTRVRQQGIWLYDYPLKCTPEILRVTSQGYEMKRYEEVPLDQLVDDPMPLIEATWRSYHEAGVNGRPVRGWVRNPFVKLDETALDSYVVDLCRQVGAHTVAFRMVDLRREIDWPTQLTWTHGDPIIDNVVLRSAEGGVVIIDAIPPCPALPSLRVVDFGRFIQSAAGYEQIRYAATTPKDDVWQDRVATVLNWVARDQWNFTGFGGFDNDAVHATLFYSIVHMLRGARTATERPQQEQMIDQARNLLEELEAWMR